MDYEKFKVLQIYNCKLHILCNNILEIFTEITYSLFFNVYEYLINKNFMTKIENSDLNLPDLHNSEMYQSRDKLISPWPEQHAQLPL